jgi:uncharacterized LabA/DUF88 family protein
MIKVAMAVDVSNIYCQARSLSNEGNGRAEYDKLRHIVYDFSDLSFGKGEPYMEISSMVFAAHPDPIESPDSYAKTLSFHNRLKYLGYSVTSKVSKNGKCNLDVELAIQAMEVCQEGRPDVFVIVSGDGDFAPLVESLRKMGIHVRVASGGDGLTSLDLRMAANSFVDLTAWLNGGKPKESKKS